MSSTDEFFIHLPSNACPTTYPFNTASNYTIQLSNPIQLDGNGWCVALNDISYTTDLKTLDYETIHCEIPHVKAKYAKHIHKTPNGYAWGWSFYDDFNEILKTYSVINATNKGEVLCKLCVKFRGNPKNVVFGFYRRNHENSYWTDVPIDDSVIQFDKYDYKIQIDIRKPKLFLQFPAELTTHLLGFRQRKSFYNQQTFTAHMDSTEPIKELSLEAELQTSFIMDKLYPFLQCQRHVIKRAGQVLSIQELVDVWHTQLSHAIGCQLIIGEDGRALFKKTSSPSNIILVDDGLLSWLHLYDQVMCFPVSYTNPASEPLNLQTQCDNIDKEWLVLVYDTTLSAVNYQKYWLHLNKVTINLPSRTYSSPAELILDLNSKLCASTAKDNIQVKLDKRTKKVKIIIVPHGHMMIERRLQEILGFTHGSGSFTSGVSIGDAPINLQQPHVRTLRVYTNIIDYVHVGSQMQQLLRTFLHEDDDKDGGSRIVMKEFVHNIYIPVREACISCIKIVICNENMHEIPFHNGKTMVTMHFKRRHL